jgi:hypothetical protein
MKFHHLLFIPKQSLPTIMPDAAHIGIRQSLKRSLWSGKNKIIAILYADHRPCGDATGGRSDS